MISEKRRDYYAGALVFLVGVGASTIAWRYQIGTLTRMGPGFFPFALGILLAFMGVLVAIANFMTHSKNADASGQPVHDAMHATQTSPDWRGWGFIVASVLAFILLADSAGLIAATFATVFIACWGDRSATLKGSALLAAGVTVFAVVLFYYILRVQIPIIRGM
jgi:putative Ca2+/H+ antiporter (TMEM165/GDT1 family)